MVEFKVGKVQVPPDAQGWGTGQMIQSLYSDTKPFQYFLDKYTTIFGWSIEGRHDTSWQADCIRYRIQYYGVWECLLQAFLNSNLQRTHGQRTVKAQPEEQPEVLNSASNYVPRDTSSNTAWLAPNWKLPAALLAARSLHVGYAFAATSWLQVGCAFSMMWKEETVKAGSSTKRRRRKKYASTMLSTSTCIYIDELNFLRVSRWIDNRWAWVFPYYIGDIWWRLANIGECMPINATSTVMFTNPLLTSHTIIKNYPKHYYHHNRCSIWWIWTNPWITSSRRLLGSPSEGWCCSQFYLRHMWLQKNECDMLMQEPHVRLCHSDKTVSGVYVLHIPSMQLSFCQCEY